MKPLFHSLNLNDGRLSRITTELGRAGQVGGRDTAANPAPVFRDARDGLIYPRAGARGLQRWVQPGFASSIQHLMRFGFPTPVHPSGPTELARYSVGVCGNAHHQLGAIGKPLRTVRLRMKIVAL